MLTTTKPRVFTGIPSSGDMIDGDFIIGDVAVVNGQIQMYVGSNAWVPISAPAYGKVYYVDKTYGSDSNSGLSWLYPFKTITAAKAVIANHDIIIIGTGVYTEAAYPLTFTTDHNKVLGVMSSGHQWGQPSVKTTTAVSTIAVDSPNIGPEIAFLSFHVTGAGWGIEVARTVNSWRTHIHDCYFGGNSAALWGAILGNTTASGIAHSATVDAPCTVLERCYFEDFTVGNIFFNCGGGSKVNNNVLQVPAGLIGIQYYTDSTSRPYAFILDNKFTTPDNVSAIGISITNTPTPGYLMIDGNRFNYFADDNHCVSKRTGYMGLNYRGITAIAVT